MKNNPKGDWVISDLEKVAEQFGIGHHRPTGSHTTFELPGHPEIVTVPAHRPIKPVYIRQFVALVETARGE